MKGVGQGILQHLNITLIYALFKNEYNTTIETTFNEG